MTTESVTWEAPPDDTRGGKPSTNWDPVAAELREHPGEWAKIADDAVGALVTKINHGRSPSWEPAGHYEATARPNGQPNRRVAVWARYVGPTS